MCLAAKNPNGVPKEVVTPARYGGVNGPANKKIKSNVAASLLGVLEKAAYGAVSQCLDQRQIANTALLGYASKYWPRK